MARLTPPERFAFIAGERTPNTAPLSDFEDASSWLSPADLIACDWLPGSVAAAYRADGLSGAALVKSVLIKEHFARAWDLHPAEVSHDGVWAWSAEHPRTRYALAFDRARKAWQVRHG